MIEQEGDVKLFQTNDNGDIIIEGGITEMTQTFDTMAYLCLFGGNKEDTGRPKDPNNWWGNVGESDPDFQYRSETQNLLQALPPGSANLRRLEQAAFRDLAVFTNKKIANEVEVFASLIGVNRVSLSGVIRAIGQEFNFNFTANWGASTNGV